MQQKVVLAVIAVVVIAGGAFLLTHRRSNNQADVSSTSTTNGSNSSDSTNNSEVSGTIQSLFASGGSKMCTYKSNPGAEYESSGVVYVANGKIRTDYTGKGANGEVQSGHLISDGTTGYMWNDQANSGIKMPFAQYNTASNTAPNGHSTDYENKYDFHCQGWLADNSKFEVPTGVQFSEMPAMPSSTNGTSEVDQQRAIRQAVCNNMPEPDKSQCLSSIH